MLASAPSTKIETSSPTVHLIGRMQAAAAGGAAPGEAGQQQPQPPLPPPALAADAVEIDKVTQLHDKTDELALSLFDALRSLPSAQKANHASQVQMHQMHGASFFVCFSVWQF